MLKPFHIMFEVTPRCNNSCLYCYNVWKANENYPQGELGLAAIKNLFSHLINVIQLEAITLTGGEPTLRSDLIEIISYFKENKVRVSLATNGRLIDKPLAKKLADIKLDSVEIPLLSTNKSIHNELTQNNSYDQVLEAIKNTTENKIPTAVVFVATKKNIFEAVSVLNLADSLSAEVLLFDRFIPAGVGLEYKNELGLEAEDIFECIKGINEALIKNAHRIRFRVGIPLDAQICADIKCALCLGGQEKFAIDFLGNLRICEQHPLILGNLFEYDFLELIDKEEVNYFKNEIWQKHSCGLDSTRQNFGCKVEALKIRKEI